VSVPKYVVVVADLLTSLEDEVNAKLAEGYRPSGSLAILPVEESDDVSAWAVPRFYQPMLLEPGVGDVEEAPQRRKLL
jgi:hypothetical protein